MGVLRRRIQIKRAGDRDELARLAYRWRITVSPTNKPPQVREGLLFVTRDGGFAPAHDNGWNIDSSTVLAVLQDERRRSGDFPERVDIHEAPRPDPADQRPPQPLTHRRGSSGLGLGTFAERAERARRAGGQG